MSQNLKTLLPLILSLIVAPLICCSSLLYIPVLLHNIQLYRFAENLYLYPLPLDSKVISQQSGVGLTGNGNHCDFWAEQIIATELTSRDIEAYYQDVKLPSVYGGNDVNSIDVEFDNLDAPDGGVMFKMRIFEFGKPTNFDFRCH